ncbi:hypothetical protein LTR95_003044 [Oleoguttula sp. CCFEE 5521]
MVDPRPPRTREPSGKARADEALVSSAAKVSKQARLKGGSRRGGGRSQSQPAARQSGSSLAARGAQSQALNQVITNITSSPPLSSPDGSTAGGDGTQLPRGTVDEDVEEEQGLDGTPEPPSDQSAFMYNSQIQIVTLRRYTSGGGTHWPIDEGKRWIESEVAKLTGYGLSKIVLRVGFERLGEKSWLTDNVDNFAVLFDNMRVWHAENKKGLKLVVQGQTVAATAPPAASQGRRSATNDQRAMLSTQREQLEGQGNLAVDITERWICKVKNCDNYSHLCYWGWAQGIRDGTLTVDAPSGGMIQQMESEHRRNAVRNGGKESSNKAVAQTPSTHFSFAFDSDKKVVARPVANEAPTSSPVRMPASQSSSIELREQFFAWCNVQSTWRGEGAALERMASVFAANGFSVDGIGTADLAEWKDLDLASGYRRRMRRSVKEWLLQRGVRVSDHE